ncbi:hypothetical protein MnTg02_00785 [bacterium MnTg02]|nr:hypothetical protein MnTg02_00785 [bacterium MnTg02]
MKTILPLAITATWLAGQKGRAIAGLSLFLIFSAYSLTSALGLYSLSRANSVGTANAGKATYAIAKEEGDRIKSRLDKLGQTRTVGEVEGDIAAGKANKRYATTKGCSPREITATKSRAFCDQYARLNGELATAREAQDLRKRLLAVSAKIGGMDLSKVLRSADPQSEALAKLTGYSPEAVRTALAALVAVLIEFGSGLGLWVVTGGASRRERSGIPKKPIDKHLTQARPETCISPLPAYSAPRLGKDLLPSPDGLPVCPIERFTVTHIQTKKRAEVTAKNLYEAFRNWAKEADIHPVNQTKFGRAMVDLGYRKERRGGTVRYLGVELSSAPDRVTLQ